MYRTTTKIERPNSLAKKAQMVKQTHEDQSVDHQKDGERYWYPPHITRAELAKKRRKTYYKSKKRLTFFPLIDESNKLTK